MAGVPKVTFESLFCVFEFFGASGSVGALPGHNLRALLRRVLLHDSLGVHPIVEASDLRAPISAFGLSQGGSWEGYPRQKRDAVTLGFEFWDPAKKMAKKWSFPLFFHLLAIFCHFCPPVQLGAVFHFDFHFFFHFRRLAVFHAIPARQDPKIRSPM